MPGSDCPALNPDSAALSCGSLCKWNVLSHVQLSVTPWTLACQAPLSMGFSRQEHWSELPFPPPGDLPNPGIEPESPVSPALQAGGLPLSRQGGLCKWKTGENRAYQAWHGMTGSAKLWQWGDVCTRSLGDRAVETSHPH